MKTKHRQTNIYTHHDQTDEEVTQNFRMWWKMRNTNPFMRSILRNYVITLRERASQ